VRHGAVENELGPIRAKHNIAKRLLIAVLNSLIPIKSGGHVQKALNRDGFLSVIDVRNTVIGKEIQNRTIETVKYSVVLEHADQRADDRLCRRVYLMRNICGVGCVIGLGDNF
jgi:threonyl-tRNA synthetase